MPRSKTADVLAEQLKPLTDAIKGIEERLVKLEKSEEPVSKAESVPVEEKKEENPEHRKMVNEILNKNFDFRVEQEFGGMRFTVSVPRKYSNASQGHWEMYKEDLRPSMPFSGHEAESAVKAHLELVFSSFNPDMKALILNDR